MAIVSACSGAHDWDNGLNTIESWFMDAVAAAMGAQTQTCALFVKCLNSFQFSLLFFVKAEKVQNENATNILVWKPTALKSPISIKGGMINAW